MKVKDLIEALKALPPDLMVVRAGYEGGVTEISDVNVIEIALNVNSEWYYGKHEEVSRDDKYEGKERATAVELT